MTTTQAPAMGSPLSTHDYSGWQSWEVIEVPDGSRLYVVPGTDGRFVYDPVMSEAKGAPVVWNNPKSKIEKQQVAEQQQKAALDLQKQQSSPLGQAAAMVAPVAGIVGANYALQHTAPVAAKELITTGPYAGNVFMTDGTIQTVSGQLVDTTATTGVQALGSTATTTGEAFLGPGVPGAEGVVVDPTIGASGFELGGIGSAGNYYLPALGAIGAYDVLANDRGPVRGPLQGAASGAAMGSWFGPQGALIGAGIGGAVGLGKSLLDKPSTKEIQDERWKAAGQQNPYADGHDYFAGTGGEQSRDESFLTVDAIRLNPDNWNAAADYGSWTKEQQDQFLNDMLQNGKVEERKGGIYYDDAYAKQVAERVRSGGVATTPIVVQQQAAPIARSPNAITAPGATVAPMVNTVPMAAVKPTLPPRSRTSSPGVALPGVTLTARELGERLAQRSNGGR